MPGPNLVVPQGSFYDRVNELKEQLKTRLEEELKGYHSSQINNADPEAGNTNPKLDFNDETRLYVMNPNVAGRPATTAFKYKWGYWLYTPKATRMNREECLLRLERELRQANKFQDDTLLLDAFNAVVRDFDDSYSFFWREGWKLVHAASTGIAEAVRSGTLSIRKVDTNRLVTTIQELQASVATKNDRIQALEQIETNFNTAQAEWTNTKTQLDAQISGFNTQIQNLQTELGEEKDKNAKAVQKLEADLKAAKEDLGKAKEALGQAEEKLAKQVSEFNAKIQKLEENSKKTEQDLKKQITDLDEKNAILLKENATLQKNIVTLENGVLTLQENARTMKTSLDEKERMIGALQQIVETNSTEIFLLKEQMANLIAASERLVKSSGISKKLELDEQDDPDAGDKSFAQSSVVSTPSEFDEQASDGIPQLGGSLDSPGVSARPASEQGSDVIMKLADSLLQRFSEMNTPSGLDEQASVEIPDLNEALGSSGMGTTSADEQNLSPISGGEASLNASGTGMKFSLENVDEVLELDASSHSSNTGTHDAMLAAFDTFRSMRRSSEISPYEGSPSSSLHDSAEVNPSSSLHDSAEVNPSPSLYDSVEDWVDVNGELLSSGEAQSFSKGYQRS